LLLVDLELPVILRLLRLLLLLLLLVMWIFVLFVSPRVCSAAVTPPQHIDLMTMVNLYICTHG